MRRNLILLGLLIVLSSCGCGVIPLVDDIRESEYVQNNKAEQAANPGFTADIIPLETTLDYSGYLVISDYVTINVPHFIPGETVSLKACYFHKKDTVFAQLIPLCTPVSIDSLYVLRNYGLYDLQPDCEMNELPLDTARTVRFLLRGAVSKKCIRYELCRNIIVELKNHVGEVVSNSFVLRKKKYLNIVC
ncbi:hypothetical protein DMA11_06005 [Marinilabiliaceae bacterium JC017]|nr:hypothetical protein DMA11_06005 [Marinilabiliaceae bacterium JC017]